MIAGGSYYKVRVVFYYKVRVVFYYKVRVVFYYKVRVVFYYKVRVGSYYKVRVVIRAKPLGLGSGTSLGSEGGEGSVLVP